MATTLVTGRSVMSLFWVMSMPRHAEIIREHAKKLREDAHEESDPLTKARLHQFADELDETANQIERDHERRS